MRTTQKLLLLTALAVVLATSGSCGNDGVWGSQLFHTASDGTSLAATYLRPQGPQPVPVFILLHQPGSVRNRNDFDSIWQYLGDQGVALLAPDLRGHGQSDAVADLGTLNHDPTGYPADLETWLGFLEYRRDEGDPLDMDRIAVIGLSAAASLAAAAVGTGRAHCAVAVSAQISEVNALAAGLIDDHGDDDDSAAANDHGDDDDSAAANDHDEDDAGVHPDLAMHDIRWLYSRNDEPSASDSPVLSSATHDDTDLVEFLGAAHGVELLWNNDIANDAIVSWCLSQL